jgi:hypothetical protein
VFEDVLTEGGTEQSANHEPFPQTRRSAGT